MSRLRERLHQTAGQQLLPVPPELAALLPDGGLRRGAAYSVNSAGALLLALLAEPSREGSWCGVVGLPEFGVEAAELAGVQLNRLVLVPQPGERWLSVVAALAEVFGVVAVRPQGRVRDADASRLAARLRDRGTVLLTVGPWPQAVATLTLERPRWDGLGAGHGYLAGREVTVTVTSKRAPGPRSVRLLLPDGDGRLARAAQSHEQFVQPASPPPVPFAEGLRVAG